MGNMKFKFLISLLSVIFVSSIGYVVFLLMQDQPANQSKVLSKADQERLLELFENGDPSAYQDYIKDGSRLTFVFEDGETPLEKLILNNDFTGANEIIDTGFHLKDVEDIDPIDTLAGIIEYNKNRYIPDINDLLIKLIEQVKEEIEDPNQDPTLLFKAIETDNYQLVEKLLDYLPNINQKYGGHTPLSYAALWGASAAVFDVILAKGANINATIDIEQLGLSKLTPIMVYLIYQGDDEAVLVQLLTHTSLDPNKVDSEGNTILHYAVKYERLRAVRSILLHTDIDPSIPSKENLTALELAQELLDEFGDSSDFDEIVDEITSHGV